MFRATFAITLALAVAVPSTALARKPGLVDGDYCDEPGEQHSRWSSQDRARTRARTHAACQALGASPIICAYDDAIVSRESFGGEASVRHTSGVGENGLGPMGLSIPWHADKWPGDDLDPALCTPEASVVVAHEIMWRAVTRYGASNIVELQAVYGGRFRCVTRKQHWVRHLVHMPIIGWLLAPLLSEPERECFTMPSARVSRRLCERMAARGFDCFTPISAKDLGTRLPLGERRRWAIDLAQDAV